MNLDWIIGFVEGEGSFTGSWRTETYYQPHFHIYQNDRSVLVDIQQYLYEEHQIGMTLSSEGCGVGVSRKTPFLGLNKVYECDKVYHLFRPRMFSTTKIAQAESWHNKLGYKGRNVKTQLECIANGRIPMMTKG